MKVAGILVTALVLGSAACGTTTTQPDQDPGLSGEGATLAADTNPEGVPYPSDNLGTVPRDRNAQRPGNRINNYKFLGYPDADKAGGLKPISLANFFDPEGKRYKLIHIQASGVWCVYCQRETEILVPMAQKLADRKVLWIVSLAEGPTQGTPSKTSDLNGWIAQFQSPFTHVLDPGNKNLGPFYDAAALPWNANINAKTMEILQAGVGAHSSEKQILDEVDEWIAQIDAGQIK